MAKRPDSDRILPDKLSDLLEIAVADAKACELDPRYVLEMRVYHSPNNDKCEVCLAGAVIARRLHAPSDERRSPEEYRAAWKLKAIDAMRGGDFEAACNLLGVEYDRDRFAPIRVEIDRTFNYGALRADWATYERVVGMLRKIGL